MQSERSYEIFIKPLSDNTLTMTVTGHTTTTELGSYFENECDIPLDQQKLIFRGKHISTREEEIQLLFRYGIKKDSILNIIWNNPKCSSE